MARTLWGNILESLAGAGINTAAKVGAGLILNPIEEEAKKRLLGTEALIKSYMPVLATGTSQEQEAVAPTLEKIIGGPLPRMAAEGFTPAGVPLTPGNRMGLQDVYNKGTTTNQEFDVGTTNALVRPTPSLEQMKVGLAQQLSPEARMTALLPKDATLQAARENLIASLAFKKSEGEANREQRALFEADRAQRAAEALELRKIVIQGQLQNQSITHQLLGDRIEAGARSQLDKALANVVNIQKDQLANPEALATAVNKYNALHGSIIAKHPELANDFNPLDIKMSEPGKIKQLFGVTPKPIGVQERVGGAVPTTPSAPVLTFPRRVKVNGVETIVNSLDEYNALQKGLKK